MANQRWHCPSDYRQKVFTEKVNWWHNWCSSNVSCL